VQIFFHWLLLGLTVASVWLWLRALRCPLPPLAIGAIAMLTIGSVPVVQGVKLQQLSLLAGALLAGSAACVAGGFLFCGGALLAVATLKPQLSWPLVGWFLLWAFSEWRARRMLVLGFGLVMALLLAGAEIILPGWWRMFAAAIEKYHRYTQNRSVLEELVPWGFAGKILGMIAVLGCAYLLWRMRHQAADSKPFSFAIALTMALTVLVVPMYAPYNQVLLLPPVLALGIGVPLIGTRSRGVRFLYLAAGFALAWQWIARLGLTGAYLFISREWALGGWKWPFVATFALPVLIFALIFVEAKAVQENAMVAENGVVGSGHKEAPPLR